MKNDDKNNNHNKNFITQEEDIFTSKVYLYTYLKLPNIAEKNEETPSYGIRKNIPVNEVICI